MRQIFALSFILLSFAGTVRAQELTPKIAWYGTLEKGLLEAKRSNRPILLDSGAPQCLGVSGTW